MSHKLKDVCHYSEERVSLKELNRSNYITTDNLLPNKKGKAQADNLPPTQAFVVRYEQGDILVSNIRPYLKKIWFADTSGGNSADVLTFKVKEGFHPKFVYYSLFRDDFFNHMMKGSKGTKMPRGDKNQILGFTIPKFKFNDQVRIAKILSDLDAKIEINIKINDELENIARTIYDYWFVQFDFPDANGKPYKASGGKMIFNDELKREIPDGWQNGVLDNIAEIVRGVSYNKHDVKTPNDDKVTPILRATNITGNVIDLEKMVYVPDEFVSEKQLMNKYDILITMSSGSKDHIGKNGMFYFDKKVAFGAFCAKLEAKKDYQFYLSSYMQSEFISETIKKECLGTNINNLNGTIVKGFRIIKPDIKTLNKFNNLLKPIHDKIGTNYKENQKLAELRDWLLPMLMNGQVTVKEAQEHINKAAEPQENYG